MAGLAFVAACFLTFVLGADARDVAHIALADTTSLVQQVTVGEHAFSAQPTKPNQALVSEQIQAQADADAAQREERKRAREAKKAQEMADQEAHAVQLRAAQEAREAKDAAYRAKLQADRSARLDKKRVLERKEHMKRKLEEAKRPLKLRWLARLHRESTPESAQKADERAAKIQRLNVKQTSHRIEREQLARREMLAVEQKKQQKAQQKAVTNLKREVEVGRAAEGAAEDGHHSEA